MFHWLDLHQFDAWFDRFRRANTDVATPTVPALRTVAACGGPAVPAATAPSQPQLTRERDAAGGASALTEWSPAPRDPHHERGLHLAACRREA